MSTSPPPEDYPDPRDPLPPQQPPPRSSDGRGWMLATIGLVALALGVGAGLLIDRGGNDDDAQVQTIHVRTTVTASPPTTQDAVTVTQPPAETIVRTETVEVTVTAPPETGTTTP